MPNSSPIKLRVLEARSRDVGRKIARLSEDDMASLAIQTGDYIEVKGAKGSTILKALPDYDLKDGSIRIDGYSRSSIGASIGDEVSVSKAVVEPATKVVLAPTERIRFDKYFMDYVKEQLLNKPITRGENIQIPIFGTDLTLVVANTQPTTHVYVNENTEVIIREEPLKQQVVTTGIVTWEDIGDLEDVKQKIREIAELPMKHPELFKHLGIEPPKGILLYGPPGVGKTLLAKALANEIGAYFTSINGPEIMSKFYGESEQRLREIFKEAEENAPAIIFIDEIDAIAPKREEVIGEVEKRVVAQLLTLMDGMKERGKIIVIGATNRPEAIDPALRRPGRFDREIEIRPPDERARKEILQVHTRNMPLKEDVNLDKIAEMTHGYTGADIAALAKEAALNALRKFIQSGKIDLDKPIPSEVLKELSVGMQDFLEAMRFIQPTLLREVFLEVPKVKWDDIGGLEDVKQQLREAVEWQIKYPEIFDKMGIRPPKGVLLYGPPGVGKTLLAKAVATESGANFIAIRGPEVLSKWVGESEKAIREIFRKARQAAPTVIFLDEIDSITPVRGASHDSGVTERIVNQLLSEMDGIIPLSKVVVIAATNRPDIIDPALLRPGRFDRLIYIKPPDSRTRLEILKIHTKKVPLSPDVNLQEIAERTEGYTGADLEALVREAVMIALREKLEVRQITKQHFESALKVVQPSLTRADIERFDRIARELKRAIA
jgi:transitional endoplasmic reticulum ATPase